MIDMITAAAAISVAGAIGIGALGYRRISGVMPYLYANARIQARPGRLLSKGAEEELPEKKSLRELLDFMGGSDYLAGLGDAADARSLHLHLEKHMVQSIEELRGFSPQKFNMILDSYLMFYEARMLKSFYRSRYNKTKAGLSEDIVFPVGMITDVVLQKLSDTQSVQDIAVVMAGTPYAGVLSKDFASLEEFEVTLDSFVLGRFRETVLKSKLSKKREILDVIDARFDIVNLINLVKCIVRKTQPEWRERLMIENDSELGGKIKSLCAENDIKGLVNGLEGTEYSDPMSKALEEFGKDGFLSHFEVALWRHFKERVTERELYFQQGPYPLLSHIVKKELEVRNIMAASKGVEAGLSRDEIREVMI
jgi:vacuolar-type H+-ATPase subunit C/Vma6